MFGTYASAFRVYKERHGEEQALGFMARLFVVNLTTAYDANGFTKGSPESFAKAVGERDASVGLRVTITVINDNTIMYEFHDDPFPMLKGLVDPRQFDATYMKFKIEYLLGGGWMYTTPEHIWENGTVTKHIIRKIT